jgi:hypothetical protein
MNKMEIGELIGRFNHRVLRTRSGGVELYKIVTVTYDLDGTPTDYTLQTSTGDAEELYRHTIECLEAFGRPILDESEIDFSRSVLEKEDSMVGLCYQEKLWD